MEKNYKLIIGYDGTRYFGWEHQPGKDTIQGKLEDVLNHLAEEPVLIIGAGRTDAGVHARAMVANVVLSVDMTAEQLRDYMNRYLPDYRAGSTGSLHAVSCQIQCDRKDILLYSI